MPTAPTRPEVFLSHSSRDKGFVRRLKEALENYAKTFVDEQDIPPGAVFPVRTSDAIDRVHYFVYVSSRNSLASEWVAKELAQAVYRRTLTKRSTVIPVLIEGDTLPESLRSIEYADFRTVEERDLENTHAFRKLLVAMQLRPSPLGTLELRLLSDVTVETLYQLRGIEVSLLDRAADLRRRALDLERCIARFQKLAQDALPRLHDSSHRLAIASAVSALETVRELLDRGHMSGDCAAELRNRTQDANATILRTLAFMSRPDWNAEGLS